MDIKSLFDIFSEHEIKAEKGRQRDLKSFKERFPGEKMPAHLLDDFNLAIALKLMCEEIIEIKNKLGNG